MKHLPPKISKAILPTDLIQSPPKKKTQHLSPPTDTFPAPYKATRVALID